MPIGALPVGAAPMPALAARLIPNCAVPTVEVQPEVHAAIVLVAYVRVVPLTVTVAPEAPFVASVMLDEADEEAVAESVPRLTVVLPRLKVRDWGTVADTTTELLERIGTVTVPESAAVEVAPPKLMV